MPTLSATKLHTVARKCAGKDWREPLTATIEAPSTLNGVERVHEHVRQAILHGDLAPGSSMSQVQLARELGVSRTPLREALRMLQCEGLVDAETNRSFRVAAFSVEDHEQLYALRITNEGLGIRTQVPQMTPADDEYLTDAIARMERLANGRDLRIWEEQHRAFHQRLVGHAGQRLGRNFAELFDHSERYRRLYFDSEPGAWSLGAKEHREIAEACIARDAPEAAARLARHLARIGLTLLMRVAPEHEPSTIRTALRVVTEGTGAQDQPERWRNNAMQWTEDTSER